MQRNDWDLPEPEVMTRSGFPWGWIAAALLVPVAALASFYLPLPPFYAYQPGPVRNIETLVDVDGTDSYSSEGSLLMTTVTVDTEVTFFNLIQVAIDPDKVIVMKEEVTGGGPLEEQIRQQREAMESSKRHAREVALSTLGFGSPRGDGARVVTTIEGFPAEGKLQEGDVITTIEGRPVTTTCDVGKAIGGRDVGERITLTVARNGREVSVPVKTVADPNDPGASFIGVAMEDVNYRFKPSIGVSFETGKIAGPSAGLMMALALYDRLTPDDLTGGRTIAGTGTIACDGGVGPIGGIEQKIAAAEARGAQVFLAPAGNADAAREAARSLEVVAISNFEQAIEYLEGFDKR